MNKKTVTIFNRVFADDSITRLVDNRAQRIRIVHPALSSCRVVLDPQPGRKGTVTKFRVRLYTNQISLSSLRPAYPEFLEIHALTAVMADAVNIAFDKLEELLSPWINPVPAHVA